MQKLTRKWVVATLGLAVIMTAGWQATSGSQSGSQSGSGSSSASSSSSAQARGGGSSSGSGSGSVSGGGQASATRMMLRATHGIVFRYEGAAARGADLAESRERYITRLRTANVLIVGVDWKSQDGEVWLIAAEGNDQARTIAASHPFVQAKLAQFEVKEINSFYMAGLSQERDIRRGN